MFVDFVLSETAPAADVIARTVDIGRLSDGFFIDTLPIVCEFGGVIEVSFEDNERGVFEVELVGEPLGGDPPRAIENWLLEIPPPHAGFPVPRTRALPFAASICSANIAEIELALYIRDQLDDSSELEWYAARFIVIRES